MISDDEVEGVAFKRNGYSGDAGVWDHQSLRDVRDRVREVLFDIWDLSTELRGTKYLPTPADVAGQVERLRESLDGVAAAASWAK